MIKSHVLKLKMFSRKLIFLLFVATFTINYNTKAQNSEKFRVVIDPAHGGEDVGSEAFGVKEKNITLKIALFIEEILGNRSDIELILTRREDNFVSLKERTKIVNDTNASLFISIHANASQNESLFGAESFVLGLPNNDKDQIIAIQENSVIKFEDDFFETYNWYDPDSSEYYNNFRFVTQKYFDKSQYAAKLIQNNFESNFGRKDRGVKKANFIVLRDIKTPGVIVQLGYLSNFREHYFLMLSNNQKRYAQEICNAIITYQETNDLDIKDLEVKKVVTKENDSNGNSQVNVKQDSSKATYYVQIISTNKNIELKPQNFNGLEDISKISEGDINKYRYGKSKSFEEINDFLKKAKDKGYKDAYIVAYLGEKKVPLSAVQSQTKDN